MQPLRSAVPPAVLFTHSVMHPPLRSGSKMLLSAQGGAWSLSAGCLAIWPIGRWTSSPQGQEQRLPISPSSSAAPGNTPPHLDRVTNIRGLPGHGQHPAAPNGCKYNQRYPHCRLGQGHTTGLISGDSPQRVPAWAGGCGIMDWGAVASSLQRWGYQGSHCQGH